MIILPGDSKGNNEEKHSIQPMGSQFEQMSFLIFDAIVLNLWKTGIRHRSRCLCGMQI